MWHQFIKKRENVEQKLVSVFPILSKLYEDDMDEQIYSYVKKYLSPYLFGYRKEYGTQHCLKCGGKHLTKIAGAILTDL